LDPFLRKVGLSPCAWRSTGLAVHHNLFLRHETPLPSQNIDSLRHISVSLFRDLTSDFRCFCQVYLRRNAHRALEHG
jgi:hypothetical protein